MHLTSKEVSSNFIVFYIYIYHTHINLVVTLGNKTLNLLIVKITGI
jgi:hypothetical protein